MSPNPAQPSTAFSLWPDSASTIAPRIDAVYLGLIGLTLFFVVLIGALALGFGAKYRAGAQFVRRSAPAKTLAVELTFIVAPLIMAVAIFVWGAYVFVDAATPPADARSIYVVGQQWMWKVRHASGRQEINELHVPQGEPIKLILTSQDVIHSFFVPAFRLKADALPGRYTSLWFEASRPGAYHLFCAEYCGTDHAVMKGRVVVLTPADFQKWIERTPEGVAAAIPENPPESSGTPRGSSLFVGLQCVVCHADSSTSFGPSLHGLYGSQVALRDGRTARVDEEYIRQSILKPNADIPLNYPAPSSMPPYAGQITEAELAELIEYIKSLGGAP